MSWPAPGIYRNINPKTYFALTEIDGKLVRSNSMLKQFNKDPALYKAGMRLSATKAMKRGSLFDCLLTQANRFNEEFVVSPYEEFRTNESKAWKKSQTLAVVTQAEVDSAIASVDALKRDKRWQEITAGDVAYQVGLRVDINGSPFRALLDVLPDKNGPYGDYVIDVKRLGQMEDMETVMKTCKKFGYADQMGLYRGMLGLLGEKRDKCLLFCVPEKGPVTPCAMELGEHMLANGAHKIMRIEARLSDCERTGIWPGRFDGIKRVEQADETWSWKEVEEELEPTAA